MSNYVFVLDKNKKPLDPTHPAKARKMLKVGRAKVFRRYPFTVIMQDLEVENCVTHNHQLKCDSFLVKSLEFPRTLEYKPEHG